MNCLGCKYSDGEKGLTKNHQKAMEWWNKAAKLGSSTANRNIAALPITMVEECPRKSIVMKLQPWQDMCILTKCFWVRLSTKRDISIERINTG
mmetsp:Transcript_26897/g.36007  ORF Transcript_26897/g.36007 Transcript_26897/m.36007 type:complete len:93 (+) Transcript_26897:707-985(+)